jgi:octaprenyl-diphosphate synthase
MGATGCLPYQGGLLAGMNAAHQAPRREIPPLRLVDRELRQVDELIRRTLAAPQSLVELSSLLNHFAAGTGKMLRPGLVLLAGSCFGPPTQQHIQVAAVMEMIHGATLLHDDVLDDGQTRRGIATVNHLWGNEPAILLGDFVLSQVFRLVAEFDPTTARTIADTAIHVCQGELRQVIQKRNWELMEAEYISIISDKSAAFFSSCCRLGASLASASHEQVEALARYGLLGGIAFQMTDDLLDITGDESQTGKTAQSDLAARKLTLPLIHLLRSVDASTRNDVCAMLGGSVALDGRLEELLLRHGSLDYVRQRARQYAQEASDALDRIPSGPARDALRQTADFLVSRMA